MEIGTGFITCQRRPDDTRSMTEIYDELLALTRTAERVGLDSVWLSEHHFSEDGYLPGTMPALGAMAAATDRIEVGTYIALAPLYDPVRLAEDTATVDLLSGGRLSLGLGLGYRDEEFDGFGVPKSERAARLADTVAVLRGAWSKGPLGYESAFHPVPSTTNVTPKPEGGPSILLGGMAQPAVRRAARLGDGWAGEASNATVEDMKKRVDDIRRVRAREGLDREFTIYIAKNGFVGDSREDAWAQIEDGILHMRRTYDAWAGVDSVDESEAKIAALKDRTILGTPAEVTAEIERYRDVLGDDVHFIFKTYFPGIGTDTMVECLERVGTEIAPHFQ